jgi:hypothetical protein
MAMLTKSSPSEWYLKKNDGSVFARSRGYDLSTTPGSFVRRGFELIRFSA